VAVELRKADEVAIAFFLNGARTLLTVREDEKLLETLRERCGIVSPKNACMPVGGCGACTVLVGGKPTLSCVLPSRSVDGKEVLTLEGLADRDRAALADGFVRVGGLQCGFCAPGVALRTKALYDRDPHAGAEECRKALQPHICRCTGYKKLIDGMREAGRALRGEAGEACEGAGCGRIGSSLERYQGRDLVLGQREFVDDMRLPGMLHGALVFGAHPRARVLFIDVGPALLIPGVRAAITAADVPGERLRGLVERDWPVFVAEGEITRYVGDVLAAIAADDAHTARLGAQAVRVTYEVLEPVTSPAEALQPGAPRLHPGGNILSTSRVVRGDVEAALAGCAHVVSEVFETQFIEHAFLEPEAAVAVPEDGEMLRVFTQNQGVFDDRRQLARILAIPEERLRVTLVAAGGAFGGKEDLTVQPYAALLALRTRKPVKLALSRQDSIRMHPKRHPMRLEYTVGCDGAGMLQAVKVRLVGEKGAYASVGSKVVERAAGHATGAYAVPNVAVEALAVYTNNPPCGAMRGFGVNQTAFAIEGCLDRLAEKAGLDGWEIRYRNALRDGAVSTPGERMTHAMGLRKTLEAVRDVYRGARFAGIACAIKNVGVGNGKPDIGRVRLVVAAGGETITVFTGHSEMGQGLFTILVQVVCEETGLPPACVRVVTDTARPVDCGMTTSSRATVLAGRAAIAACAELRQALSEAGSLAQLAGREFHGEYVFDRSSPLGSDDPEPIMHLTYGYATQVVLLDDEGRLAKVVAAHDVGRVLNPHLLEGQIEGALHMGLGFALTEELVVERGVPRQKGLHDLGILRARDMPEVEVIFVEEPAPEGPYGARGVGEIGLVPTAAAVAGALHAFDGIRRTKLPMLDSPAARAIRRS